MRRLPLRPLLIGAGVIVLLASLVQLLLPAYYAMKVEDRLTEDGGTASVDIAAAPATRLLSEHGDRLSVEGSGVRLSLDGDEPVLDRLDGFEEVDIELRDVDTGPLESRRIGMKKAKGQADYTLTLEGSTTPKDLAAYAADRVGGFFGELATRLAVGEGDIADRVVPVSLNVKMRSDNGDPEVVDSTASIDGIPIGPLAEAIARAVASRL